MKKKIITLLFSVLCLLFVDRAYGLESKQEPIKMAVYFGGKSYLLYRTYVSGMFEKEGLNVDFLTQYMNGDKTFILIPKDAEDMHQIKFKGSKNTYFGKVRGEVIVKAIEDEVVVGGTVGEFSFMEAVSKGSPIVAVAMLGRSLRDEPDKAIILHKEVKINTPSDFRGKTLVSRRAGASDFVFLREFIESLGLVPDKDVTIIDQVSEDVMPDLLLRRKVDGGLYHIKAASRLLRKNKPVYLYRKMDWMNAEISHSLLVFHRDFVEKSPEVIKKFVKAYMKRIRFEHQLSYQEQSTRDFVGLRMVYPYNGLNYPQTDDPPLVRVDLLKEVQRLALKYGLVTKKIDLKKVIDNEFIEEVLDEEKLEGNLSK